MVRFLAHGVLFLTLVFLEASVHRLVTIPVPLPVTLTFLCVVSLVQAQEERVLRTFLPLLLTGALAAETGSGMTPGVIFVLTVAFPLGLVGITKRALSTVSLRSVVVLTAFAVFLLRLTLQGLFSPAAGNVLHATQLAHLLLLRVVLPTLSAVPLALAWWFVVVSPRGRRIVKSFFPRGSRYAHLAS